MKKLLISFAFCSLLHWAEAQIPAFPGAEGFGALSTTGGRNGQVLKVTNLNCNGPGSLNAALSVPGPKYIVFTVSGIIDCAAEVEWGDCYIAGQTSPGGITVRGILLDDYYDPAGKARNVIIRHLKSRPSTTAVRPGTGWVLDDALRLDGARDIVVDHCSFANAVDECIQVSRTSRLTIQHCQLAETLGYHYDLGGMLMNYSVANHPQDSISIHHNIWNRIGGRMPEISCEPSGESPGDMDCLNHPLRLEYSNNLLWDIPIQIYYEPYDDFFIRPNFVNNLAVGRPTYGGPVFHHPMLGKVNNELYTAGNKFNLYPAYADYQIFYCCNDFNLYHPNEDLGLATLRTSRFPYPAITYTPTDSLRQNLYLNAGAFNAYSGSRRDSMDRRLLKFIQSNILDANPVNGIDYYHDAFLLDFSSPPAALADTDNDGMPDTWEAANGLNPAVQDHNGTQLSVTFTGVAGYTNLECYLNQLSTLVSSPGVAPACTALGSPSAGATGVPANTTLSWSAANGNPAGYRIDIGTTPGGTDLVNNLDVGNATAFDPPGFLPYGASIYVKIKPYNAFGTASGCSSQAFSTALCIPNLQVISIPVTGGLYKSQGELISLASTVQTGTVVSFTSDTGVLLGQDFVVEQGGVFEVSIQTCSNSLHDGKGTGN